ncbi:MAG TPA: TetR/AcrR family transcriptional regulator [Anaeromyxobacteraceae bacterium]|nr:TetR/AcrR family transcriptional regulator [Anaeromyxobacteraceae bacterium]
MSTSARSRSTARPSPYHHGDLRRALVEAALALVRERGADGFTLREAARRVGVSQTAPYRHFETRDALLAAVAEEGFSALRRELESLPQAVDPDPRLRLRAQGLACFRFYVADPARFRVMFSRATSQRERYPGLAAAWGRVNEVLLRSLVACQEAGEIRAGDPLELGLATAAMTHGLAALVNDGHLGPALGTDPEAVAALYQRASGVLYRGLHPPGRENLPTPAPRRRRRT